MKEDKIQVSIRIPSKLHLRIIDVMKKSPPETSKTDIIVELLESYFRLRDSEKDDVITEIDSIFSVENKVFMPRIIYKQLLTKSDYVVDKEIKQGIIDTTVITDTAFIIMEVALDTNAIMIELLVQKKSIELSNKKIEILERKLK
ncbi:hypothetical protein [Sulfurimonas sp.]|uniref:hypothetical protein n=1 Tax=Sulfurimonas sp. TaxID=2022749 RepID=UPI0025F9BBA1|nr:hypothetical protein [Sulfurimonas sp.]